MMAAVTTTTVTEPLLKRNTRVCFSFAAYSKDLIDHLHHHSNVPITQGLTLTEFSAIESAFRFSFPPDLRSLLREGLPVGHGFPNWRSSSHQQLDILMNLPLLGLCKEVYRQKFWHRRWGDRPEEDDEAVEVAKGFLKNSPLLVPVYRNYYIPSIPCLAGNPIFYVNGLDVKLWSNDVVGFFQHTEFKDGELREMRPANLLSAPVWAATEARKIEFWTELMELCRDTALHGGEMKRRWWRRNELGRFLEDVRLRLRDGGWKEEDVDEMMMEMDGEDEKSSSSSDNGSSDINKVTEVRNEREGVGRHVGVMSERLLRGGWSRGDVVESLGCLTEDGQSKEDRTDEIEIGSDGGDSFFDLKHITCSCVDDDENNNSCEV
ncbi:uncharacterized protein LOC112516342 [Cynara cardunculus var. scolymus]|uniref:Knr4/Smi1-like domain-containing protein n=1 Tax=Cynara cardunculus var. scolymus TaxID=59895 RepID=A0A118K5C8_CYNCS|nr:uncharacterized protein LOC112516342 [Cynara cardunculus var. scolymus]KVI08911.1 hypothetical protein Ccrd_012718 [Cynara cardunculus var. scolymus]